MHHVCVNKLLFVFLFLICQSNLQGPKETQEGRGKKLCFLLYTGFQYSDVLSNHNVYKTLSLLTSLLVIIIRVFVTGRIRYTLYTETFFLSDRSKVPLKRTDIITSFYICSFFLILIFYLEFQ